MKPTQRDRDRLAGLDTLLAAVTLKVIERYPEQCTVTEGLRTPERQKELVRTGKSKTLDSKHITGHAVDLAIVRNGKAVWDVRSYTELARVFAQVAMEFGLPVRWGGSWRWISGPNCHDYPYIGARFFDGPHFEIERRV